MADDFCDIAGEHCDEQQEEESQVKPERNQAQIVPMGSGLAPIYDYELYNEELQIWKGKLVIPSGTNAPEVIYFSRKYQPEVNEFDRVFTEIEILDLEILGVPFVLVPKEKFLFGYFRAPGEGIIIPSKPKLSRPRMQ